jgi:hypothetical protein
MGVHAVQWNGMGKTRYGFSAGVLQPPFHIGLRIA